ncbi:MAG: hypothetical protein AB8B69_24440 [Chitinophagales bacterium]
MGKVAKNRLYDAFGELIYAVAKADGLVQAEELTALQTILSGHPWAKEIQWSFDYENRKGNSVEEAYKKAVDICKVNGPDPEYDFLFEVLENVAKASDTVEESEASVILNFTAELKERFIKDIEVGE